MPESLAVSAVVNAASEGPRFFAIDAVSSLAILAIVGLYTRAARSAHGRPDHELTPGHIVRFAAGVLVLFVTTNGWLHDVAHRFLFTAHAVQLLLLTLLAPPLLLSGTPGWMLRPILRPRALRATLRLLTRPMVCFIGFQLINAAWHFPDAFNAALSNHAIHIAQHFTLLFAGVLLWWPVLSQLPELPRLAYPLQMLYLFLTTLPLSIVAVAVSYSRDVLYAYGDAPLRFGMTPMQDQMLGGLIMWVPGGLIFFGVISVIFFRWQAAGAEDTAASAQVDWRTASGT